MNDHTITVLKQLLLLLPLDEFEVFVGQQKADRYVKNFSCRNQLTTLLYAQASGKDSLREIETGLRAMGRTWYHLGLENVSRNTLAHANRNRPWKIYESLFNVRDQIPECILITDGKKGDITMGRKMKLKKLPSGSVITIDRGYTDYAFLHALHAAGHTFVIRLKENAQIVPLESFAVNEKGVLKDERIGFVLEEAIRDYPEDVRLVTYFDEVHEKTYRFVTNNFQFSAKTIADIYKSRWQVELFFKWIKQHLKLKTFLGTSKNAVLTQIWVAMIYYLLLAWIKHQTKFRGSLHDLTVLVAELLMHKTHFIDMLSATPRTIARFKARDNPQLALC